MIKIIKNPKLSKEETRVIQRKIEKLQEDIEYYSEELKFAKKYSNQLQVNRANNKLKLLTGDLLILLDYLA